MRKNKDVLVLEREKGRKLFLAALQLNNQVGAVADLTGRLEKARFNIISVFVSAPDADGFGRCSFFAEALNESVEPDELKRVIEKSKFVTDVEIKEAHKGLLVDSLNFPLTWSTGDRAIMLRAEFFTSMEEGISKIFGSGGDVVLYEMGYHHGEPTWRNLLKSYRVENLRDLQEALSIYNASGWGRPVAVAMDRAARTAEVRLAENFECSLKKDQMKCASNFVRGHLKGLFEVVLGTGVQVTETYCIAKGDQTCVFAVSPRAESSH